ncbi:hypothetical protein GOP47_0031117 [Adiantum capillus-veneris]|nr:hypothetical protein GOP47_0031117 [Adiantum capillus-veneris]
MEITEDEIFAAISAATAELAGPGKSIANTPINLDVCRPGAPDLTLIDLPGICTRAPVDGQPEDISDKINYRLYHKLEIAQHKSARSRSTRLACPWSGPFILLMRKEPICSLPRRRGWAQVGFKLGRSPFACRQD